MAKNSQPYYKRNLEDVIDLKSTTPAPQVCDSDGNPVDLYQNIANAFMNNNVRVDLGDSPNSNTGDPLRTAFLKLNNLMEAIARLSQYRGERFYELERHGRYLGVRSFNELQQWEALNWQDIPGVGNIVNLDYVTLSTDSDATAPENKVIQDTHWPDTHSRIVPTNEVEFRDGRYSIQPSTTLRFNSSIAPNGKFQIEGEIKLLDVFLDHGEALARLARGEADSTLSAAEQKKLYDEFIEVSAEAAQSYRIQARNIEDAFAELVAKSAKQHLDAGYY